jgi:hypothetical protein
MKRIKINFINIILLNDKDYLEPELCNQNKMNYN